MYSYSSKSRRIWLCTIEGAACGNALICFDIMGPDSLVKNNFNGLIIQKDSAFDFAKRVMELVKDKDN